MADKGTTTNTSKSTAVTTTSPAKSEGVDFKFWGAMISSIIGIALFGTSIGIALNNLGGGQNGNQEFKQHLPGILIPACIATLFLFIGLAIYIVQAQPQYALYGLLAVVCISLGVSVAALSVSIVIQQ